MKLLYRCAALSRNIVWRISRPVTIGVRVCVLDGEKVLLVKTSYSRDWQLPGGAVDRNEMLVDAASRELFEETGVKAEPASLTLVGIYFAKFFGSSNHVGFYLANNWNRAREFKANSEIVAAEFFDLQKLPKSVGNFNFHLIQEALNSRGQELNLARSSE